MKTIILILSCLFTLNICYGETKITKNETIGLAVKAATQTWTGENSFDGNSIFNSSVAINADSAEQYALTIDSNSNSGDGYVMSISTSGLMKYGSYSTASSGYTVLPNGFILNWGVFNYAAAPNDGVSGTITFSHPYINTVFNVSLTPNGSTASCDLFLSGLTTTTFTYTIGNYANASNCSAGRYLAIGY